MNEQFNWYKKTNWCTLRYTTLYMSKQATKISEIRLHYLGYKHKHNEKKTYTHKINI